MGERTFVIAARCQTIRSGDRQVARLRVTLDARITVRVPGREDFIICRNGTIANLSEEGACVLVQALPEEHLHLLKQGGQACSVVCGFPDSGEPCVFSARLAWIDVAGDSAQKKAALGLRFTEMDAAVRRRLEDLFHRLTERQ